jgi:hypothetical protein
MTKESSYDGLIHLIRLLRTHQILQQTQTPFAPVVHPKLIFAAAVGPARRGRSRFQCTNSTKPDSPAKLFASG